MHCEFEQVIDRKKPQMFIRIYDDDNVLIVFVKAIYKYNAYRFTFTSRSYNDQRCLRFLLDHNFVKIYNSINSEQSVLGCKELIVYKIKLTPIALLQLL
jgi:hypothetical protein